MTPENLTARLDKAVVRFVVTLYDNEGRPVKEVTTDPTVIFRAATPDPWQAADAQLPAVAEKLGVPGYGPPNRP